MRDNLWRVNRLLPEHEDGMQECAYVFVRMARHYEGRINGPAHFMSLFQHAIERHFTTFSRRNTRFARAEAAAFERARERADINFSEGPLYAVLSRASAELVAVLRVIANAPSELLSLMLGHIGSSREEAALSRALCRLARVRNVRSDLLAELRSLLREE